MSTSRTPAVELSGKLESLDDVSLEKLSHAKRLSAEALTNVYTVNELYQRVFQLLKLVGLEAEIPRVVVFGQQSMGKTTLLDMIMGGPIGYSSTDTGTKMPVVIILRPASQKDLEQGEGNIDCRIQGEVVKLRDLQKKMAEIMVKTDKISTTELEIELKIPNGVHAILVDLPGIKDDSKEGAELTRSVVRTYVQNNPNDLYILVKKASDDPANWPWSLREFILTDAPKGLGLTRSHTMVVGTRSKEFLLNEKTDIKTQAQLYDRVQKRCIKDTSGNLLPLYLLELFSLTIQEKESQDYQIKRESMERQIMAGRRECLELIKKEFDYSSVDVNRKLENFFDVKFFNRNLNHNFQELLNEQLVLLEKRLIKKQSIVKSETLALERELSELGPQTYRESVILFIRILFELVQQIITGNFMILKLQENGERFLESFGGNLQMNLQDGDKLAKALFPKKYDANFYTKIQENTEKIYTQYLEQQTLKKKTTSDDKGDIFALVKSDKPLPDLSYELRPGQFVRFTVSKDSSQMLGFINSLDDVDLTPSKREEKGDVKELRKIPAPSSSKQCMASFPYRVAQPGLGGQNGPPQEGDAGSQTPNAHAANNPPAAAYVPGTPSNSPTVEQVQQRPIERNKLQLVLPLCHLISTSCVPPAYFLCWKKAPRQDGWIGLEPVAIKSLSGLSPVPNPYYGSATVFTTRENSSYFDTNPLQAATEKLHFRSTVCNGEAVIKEVPTTSIRQAVHMMSKPFERKAVASLNLDKMNSSTVSIDELYVDACSLFDLGVDGMTVAWEFRSPMYRIAGDFAESKLLNQLALTHLGRWLKFHIVNLEPDKRYSPSVLLQLMRSVRHVVDKADWEPLVADLLQSNVQGNILQLTRLSACAAAVALRRILQAAVHEMKRQITAGEMNNRLLFLANNTRFMEEVQCGMEEYCQSRARTCALAMQELVFEQTHAIHFEMIQDFFDGCQKFEQDFLGSNTMQNVSEKVQSGLALRKQKLSVADVYSKTATGTMSADMIYEEVRVQFWVCKMLLAAPLTTKLYMFFVKDIKDKSQHLAAETSPESASSSDVEKIIGDKLLCEVTVNGLMIPRSETELGDHFALDKASEVIRQRVEALKRVEEFVAQALSVVSRFRQMIRSSPNGVDFLSRMDFLSSDGSGKRRIDGRVNGLTTAASNVSGSATVTGSGTSRKTDESLGTPQNHGPARPGGNASIYVP